QATATLYFNEAQLYCADINNPVGDNTTLLMLLNMLTAHIAALNSPVTPAGANPLTPPGRVSSANEGSVGAQFDAGSERAEPGSKAWYYQTKYGAAYWQATLPYRSFRYQRPRRRFRGSRSWPG